MISFETKSELLTFSTTGCLSPIILTLLSLHIVGLTYPFSSATLARDCKTSTSLITLAISCNFGIYVFTISLILINILYSSSTIFSSAFKISASFSFKIGLIYLSQLERVCLLSYPYSYFIKLAIPFDTSI